MPGTPGGKKSRTLGSDTVQLAFWLSLTVAAGAIGVVIAWPGSVGMAGPILLVAFAGMAAIMLAWIFWTRGRGGQVGDDHVHAPGETQLWLDALAEASLITDRTGIVLAASTSYRALIAEAGGDSAFPQAPDDRLFGAGQDVMAAIYRLSKAVRAGRNLVEAVQATGSSITGPITISVAALGEEKALWRIGTARADCDDGSKPGEAVAANPLSSRYIDDAPMGFFSIGADGRVVYINTALREALGVSEDVVGQSAKNTLLPPAVVGKLLKSRRQNTRSRIDIGLKTAEGKEIPVVIYTSWMGRGADATSRSIVAPASADEGASVETGASGNIDFISAPFGGLRLDGETFADAVIVEVNPAMQAMAPSTDIGRRFADLFETIAPLDEIDAAHVPDGPVEMILTDGPQTDVFFCRSGPEGAEGSLPDTAYLVDISMRKELEMRMAQGQKMHAMGQLVGGVAHDFNNLLLGMILNTDKLLIRHPIGDPSYSDLQKVKEFSARGAELVRILLACSRRQTFQQKVIDISDLLSEYYVFLRQIIDERIKLDIVHGRDLPRIRVDKGQIETALTNLATNARDAMLDSNGSGELTIRTSSATAETARADGITHIADGAYLRIQISDTGPGIDPNQTNDIFEPFFSTKEKGNGLGLATVYGIVKQSEGYIYPVSEPGKGATFNIFLPACADDADDADDAASSPAARSDDASCPDDLAGRGGILLVEDEEGVRAVAAELLTSLGYRVLQAGSGEEALEIIIANDGAIDLLISDVVMPEMDGPALLRAARQYLRNTPVMFISGYAERDLTRALDEDANVSFLPKPFTLKQLAERVKTELKSSAQK